MINELRYLGFYSIQKSVFLGENISKDRLLLTEKLFLSINSGDSYFIVRINLNNFNSNFRNIYEEDIVVI